MPAKGQRLYSDEWRFFRKKWSGMMWRCYGKRDITHKKRGIEVFKEWHDFPTFYLYAKKHLGMPPCNDKRYSLDRENNELGYIPGNIRWVDYKTQERNRSINVFVDFKGRRILLIELAEILDMSYQLLYDRLFRQNWTIDEATSIKKLDKSQHIKPRIQKTEIILELDGRKGRLIEFAKEYGITRELLYGRIMAGWSVERSLNTSISKGNASIKRAKKIRYNGEYFTFRELSEAFGVKIDTLKYRLKAGWTLEKALNYKSTHSSAAKNDIISSMSKK